MILKPSYLRKITVFCNYEIRSQRQTGTATSDIGKIEKKMEKKQEEVNKTWTALLIF